jgi:hypothetical protein
VDRVKRALVLALVLAGCHRAPGEVIAGLHSAGAQVFLESEEGERGIPVGTKLRASDRIRATGPAVVEYFEGGVHFLRGDSLSVGEAPEAKLIGATIPVRRLSQGRLVEAGAPGQRLVAARYFDVQATPDQARPKHFTQSDYLQAFFTPNGIEALSKSATAEGPRHPLPPPPDRPRVPHIHAAELGPGGSVLEVTRGFVAAEASGLETAVLPAGHRYALGRAIRLLLPKGARARLIEGSAAIALAGPLDLRL